MDLQRRITVFEELVMRVHQLEDRLVEMYRKLLDLDERVQKLEQAQKPKSNGNGREEGRTWCDERQ